MKQGHACVSYPFACNLCQTRCDYIRRNGKAININCLKRAVIKKDKKLETLDIKGEHVIHPEHYF